MTPQQLLQWLIAQGISPSDVGRYLSAASGLAAATLQPNGSYFPAMDGATAAQSPMDTGADALAGNAVVLTRTNPIGGIAMPKGWRASGQPVANITVSVTEVQYDGGPRQTAYKNPVALHVQFGSGGASHSAIVDCKHGAQLSLVGQQIALSAELEAPTDPDGPSLVRVAASIGEGTRAARAFNTRTLRPAVVPPKTGLFCRVPDFAYSFIPYADNPAALTSSATTIQFWSFAGVLPGPYPIIGAIYGMGTPLALTGQLVASVNGSAFSGAALTDGMKLPQGADLIVITNNLTDPVTWTPCFPLSL